LADALSAACAGVYSYGEAAAAIAGDLEDLDAPFQSFATMDEAFAAAAASATEGQTVLLSPACASFDLYDNYEQRGEAFKANVAALES
ncbi:MAG: UDP-N-acetylmuramoyl-L-alanine--D-glutamate ligase, partial [Solirubrobacterales bacterium]